MKTLRNTLAAMVMVIVASVAFLGCTDPMDKKLTLANYDQIVENTTTYDEVVDLLGDPQDKTALDTAGTGTAIWKNEDDTKNITLTFTTNVVTTKAQTGLE